jgi:hypothetical protein
LCVCNKSVPQIEDLNNRSNVIEFYPINKRNDILTTTF